MYIELLCSVPLDGSTREIEGELVGATVDLDTGGLLALVRVSEGYLLRTYHPSKVTLREHASTDDEYLMVEHLGNHGLKLALPEHRGAWNRLEQE